MSLPSAGVETFNNVEYHIFSWPSALISGQAEIEDHKHLICAVDEVKIVLRQILVLQQRMLELMAAAVAAPVVPKPAAPVVPKPAAPVVPGPAAPVVPPPAAPVVPQPAATVVPKPAAPVVPKPAAPVGLADTVAKDTSANADRRFKLVVAMLRQTFSSNKLRLQWCNTLQMLADGLTKVLPQVALCALMASMSYAIPTGGRTGRLGAATLLASRVVRAGGTQLVIHGEVLKPNTDTGLQQFTIMLLISYLFVFMCGVVLSWLWFGRPTVARLREVMVTEEVTDTVPRQGPQRSKTTPLTTETIMAACCEQQHNTRAGRNKSTVYLTCQDCAHHVTWLKNGQPTFMGHRDLRFMKLYWDSLQGTTTIDTSQQPVAVADERPTVHAKSTARPRQRAAVRAVASSSAAASASAHAEIEEHNSTAESMHGLTDESSEDTHLPPTTVSTAPDETTKEKTAKAGPKQRAAARHLGRSSTAEITTTAGIELTGPTYSRYLVPAFEA
jgi:hypothetical protein